MKNNNYLLWWGIFLWILITYSRGFGQVSAEMDFGKLRADSAQYQVASVSEGTDLEWIAPMLPVVSDGTLTIARPFRTFVIVQGGSEGMVAARKRHYLPGARPSPGPHFCE